MLLYLAALAIIYTVINGTALTVTQFPARVTAVKGTNVSIYCFFALLDRNALVDVYWRRAGQDGILDSSADKRKTFTPLKKESSEFHLLNVGFQESGVYYCSIRDWRGKISNGNGTDIIVYVPPTPVKITRLHSPSLTLLCTTAVFFPEELNLTWYQNGSKITSGINLVETRSEDGLYQVSSSLISEQSGTVYICEVSHASLPVPANASYTVRDPANGNSTFLYSLVSGCAAGGLIILVLVILVKRCNFVRTEDTEISEERTGHFEEQAVGGREDGSPSYAAINFSGHRNIGKPRGEEDGTVYAQTKQGTDCTLTYASLDRTGSQKMARRKQKENVAEYAAIWINKPREEYGIV
ncbi:natural cytotoxicity triggering receptor 3 ligand 1-like isoform X2 [Heptranchias perlo]|uniref:natural cytotoxicity triggering receptor 3 ligand 1-like isoform X2 n=1 Tax=Heptranchias perlo TaxID=212740 RepID=UPI0035594C17